MRYLAPKIIVCLEQSTQDQQSGASPTMPLCAVDKRFTVLVGLCVVNQQLPDNLIEAIKLTSTCWYT